MARPTKAECETVIRQLVHQWAKANSIKPGSETIPSFSEFRSWIDLQGLSQYLNFRSVMGPYEDAARWFDEELKQTWRN